MHWWLVVLLILVVATLEREVTILLLMILVPPILLREAFLFFRQRRSQASGIAGNATGVQQTAFALRSLAWLALAIAFGCYGVGRFGWLQQHTDLATGVLLLSALGSVFVARLLESRRDV